MKSETFTETYRRYAALIKKSVVARTNDEELADEICQQTFLAYYKNMDKVEESFAKVWLLRTASNLLIDYWRKASTRREIPIEEDSGEFKNRADGMNVEQRCVDRAFVCGVLEDLKRKNKSWYDVIDCICVREMSHEETAKHLGMSPVVLRAKLYRAKNYLRAKYGREYLQH